MEYDTKVSQWKNSDRNSLAWSSATERWPVIITKAIDDVHRAVSELEAGEVKIEGKKIVKQITELKYELQYDRKLSLLEDDGFDDIEGYNTELKQRKFPSWLSATWLYSECYLYRRIQNCFSLSTHWKSYDVFARSKIAGLKLSRPAVLELAGQYWTVVNDLQLADKKALDAETPWQLENAGEILFIEMAEICLWGNKTDLSLLPNLNENDMQKLQGAKAWKDLEKQILVNNLSKAFAILQGATRAKKPERRVDIVLDNAGFELFVDLILAGYLLATGLATIVVLHPKAIPWFVSDVLPKDFLDLLNALRDSTAFFQPASDGQGAKELTVEELAHLNFLFDNWSSLHAEDNLVIRPNRFWTHGGSYWRLPATAPELYEDLKKSELIIFKGDLNYRKLTADAEWDPTTPFSEALGSLGGQSGLRILALRTAKADVICGLPPGKDEELRELQPGGPGPARKWASNGEWAVIQFHDGK